MPFLGHQQMMLFSWKLTGHVDEMHDLRNSPDNSSNRNSQDANSVADQLGKKGSILF